MSVRMLVGLVSDTHGVVDPRLHRVFSEVQAIVHAGDICSDAVLHELETIAPVTAARGNCDDAGLSWFDVEPAPRVTLAGVRLLAIHDIDDLGVHEDVDVVVCGHTHVPSVLEHGRLLVVNPGSASFPRLGLGRSVALLELGPGGAIDVRLVSLDEVE